MKIFLAQLNLVVGDIKGNLQKILAAHAAGKAAKADLVLTPELSLCGYPPRDLLDRPGFAAANEKALSELAGSIQGPALCVGFVARRESKEGLPLSNAAAFIRDGKVRQIERKSLLPFYDVFDETRYFEPEPVSARRPLDFDGLKIGLTICEDAWSDPAIFQRRLYHEDPVAALVRQKADILLNMSASPYFWGKRTLRTGRFLKIATDTHLPVIAVNQVGGNDELIFDGQSVACDRNGKLCLMLNGFREDTALIDTEHMPTSFAPAAENLDELIEALSLGIRDYFQKCGFKKAVLGLSGGIDSAVTAALAARALGPGNVQGVALPSRYNVSESARDAERLAKNLGIDFAIVPIEPALQSYLQMLKPVLGGDYLGLTEENLQARIRGATLMALANHQGALLLTTGNKSEMGAGYCTLYGDMCGGLAVIADVFKTTIYKMARHLNTRAGREIIPEYTIERAPSAELRPNQTDQDSLPDYDVLDRILQLSVEEGLEPEAIIAMGINREAVLKTQRLMDLSEFKRRQAAPGLKVSAKSFGMGRRQPIACRMNWREYV